MIVSKTILLLFGFSDLNRYAKFKKSKIGIIRAIKRKRFCKIFRFEKFNVPLQYLEKSYGDYFALYEKQITIDVTIKNIIKEYDVNKIILAGNREDLKEGFRIVLNKEIDTEEKRLIMYEDAIWEK